jgi:hypothetical protein
MIIKVVYTTVMQFAVTSSICLWSILMLPKAERWINIFFHLPAHKFFFYILVLSSNIIVICVL